MPLLVRFVRGPIAFNNKISLVAIEVSDVITKLMLPPEFESKELSIPQQLP